MPHKTSAAKRLRKNDKRRKANRAVAKNLKGRRKAVEAAAKGGDVVLAGAAFQTAQAALDRAAAKGYIHPNKAARLKSRMLKRIRTQGQDARKWKFTMSRFKPPLSAAQLAERARADRAVAESHRGQTVAYVDTWDGDTLKRVVVAASTDPVEFQQLLARLEPEVRRRVQMTTVPSPAEGVSVPTSWFA